MTAKKFLLVVMWLQIAAAAALYMSNDARVEITCTGHNDVSLPQWCINGTTVAAHSPAVLRDMGIAIIPESARDAFDVNNNAFRTLVINGSAAVHGTTIRCVFANEVIFPSTELLFVAALPPPENLTVSEGGLVQWQPPYSSLETEAVRYFLYNISYSVEVTDILTQATIMYNETGSTFFSFLPPADCIEYTVIVTARCDTSVGAATVNMSTYETPEPVDAEHINATLHGNTLNVIVIAQYVLNCGDPTLYYIIYNNQEYDIQADDEMELSINIPNTDTCISIAVKASNPAGNSSLTRVGIDGCGISSETPSPTDNVPERKSSSVIPAVAATVAACGLLLIITVSIISLMFFSKWQRKNRVEHKTVTVYVGNMPEDISKRSRSSNDKSDSLHGSSVSSLARSSTHITTTMVDGKSPPSSPKEKKRNQEPSGEEYVHVKHQEETYAELVVLKQKQKCVQPPDEGVMYSGIQHPKQHPKQPVYADVALQKPKCSPPAAGSAEPVLYSLVQLPKEV